MKQRIWKAIFSVRGLVVSVLAAAALMAGWGYGARYGMRPLELKTLWALGTLGALFGCCCYIGWLLLRLFPPNTEMPPVVSCDSCDRPCPQGFYVSRGTKPGEVQFFCQGCRRAQSKPYRVEGDQVRRIQ